MFGLLPYSLVPPPEVLEAAAAAPSLTLSLPVWQRTALGYLLCWLCAAWMYLLVRPRPVGSASRVVLAAPVVVLQLAATPFLVDRAIATVLITPVTGIFSLVAFKAAAYALGRGPLLVMDGQGFLKYAAVLTMPVIPRAVFCISGGRTEVATSSPASGWDFLRMYGTKATGAALAGVVTQVPQVPILVCHWFYALCLSLSLGALWDFWCLVALLVFGVEVAPSFDQPWLSTSFADYWSRRWNLTVTYMLRVLIYEPVMQGSLAAPRKPSTQPQQQQQLEPPTLPPPAAGPTAADDTASTNSNSSCASGVFVESPVSPPAAAKPAAEVAPLLPAPAPEGVEEVESDMDSAMSHIEGLRHRRAATTKVGQLQQIQGALDPITSSSTQQPGVKQQLGSSVGAPSAKPLTRGSSKKLLRRYLALQATFAFSGAWHALIFYYNTGLWTWHWFAFFTVQAPIVTAESLLIKAATKAGWQLPRGVSIFLTNFLLIVVANPLFFGPCDWSGMCSNMMGALKAKAQ